MKKTDPPGRPGCGELAPPHHRKHRNTTQPLPDDGLKGKSGALPCLEVQNPITRVSGDGFGPFEVLATEFSTQHGSFKQIWRESDVAVFEQRRNGLLIAHETIIVRRVPERTIFGKVYPPHEVYPSFGKEWSPDGWSFGCQDRDRAFTFAQDLIRSLSLPKKDRVLSHELLAINKGSASRL